MNTTSATPTPDQSATSAHVAVVGIGSSDLLGWAFAQADDEENWTGPCETREAAIEEAWDYYGDEQSIAVAPCYKPGPDDDDDWDFVVRGHRETIEPNITISQPQDNPNGKP